jgi:hypothetical protein
MLLQVSIPNDAFNAAIKDGTVGKKIERFLAETKPEAVYFTEIEGLRSAILIVDVADPSKVPSLAEPWFLLFDASCAFHIVMSPKDLAKAGLEEIAKKWR